MDIPALIGELTADEPARRKAAADALVEVGAPAVEPLIAECRRRSRTLPDRATNRAFREGNAHVEVLRRIGDAAFGPLLRAIASAQAGSDVFLVRRAFEGLAVSDPGMFPQTLGHCHPWLRGSSLRAIESMGSGALRYAPQVVPLLGDPVGFVQGDALRALGQCLKPVDGPREAYPPEESG